MSDPRRIAASPPDDDATGPEPAPVRALRRLVTVLTVTLILGVVTIAGALVLRISASGPAAPAFDATALGAAAIVLPAGERIIATGGAGSTLILATEDAAGAERLRLFDAATGAALGTVAVERATAR